MWPQLPTLPVVSSNLVVKDVRDQNLPACGVTRAQSNKTEQAEVTPSPAGEVVSLTDFPVFNSLAK